MSYISADLTTTSTIELKLSKDVLYSPSLEGFKSLDTNYTLEFENGVKSSVGDGITIIDQDDLKSLVFVVDAANFDKGNHVGRLVSDSRISGLYLNILIKLSIC